MEIDLRQRLPLELKAEDSKRLANYRRGLDHVTCAKHMLGQLMSERGRCKTCSCEAERERGKACLHASGPQG